MRVPPVSIVTTALAHREHFLRRLVKQAPWIRDYEWVISGPEPLSGFAKEVGAKFVASDACIGTCRNLCAEAATGEIIVQMDDDDWQHRTRVKRQIDALLGPEITKEVVGSTWLYCLESDRGVASRMSYWGARHALPGATLAYWRSSWKRHPFPDTMSEDGPFTQFFGSQGTCFDMHDPKLLVYMRHPSHRPEQQDWWKETRDAGRRLSAQEIMRRKIQNPARALELVEAETPRDIALAHEEEAATVYVQWLMGDDFFDYVSEPSFVGGGV